MLLNLCAACRQHPFDHGFRERTWQLLACANTAASTEVQFPGTTRLSTMNARIFSLKDIPRLSSFARGHSTFSYDGMTLVIGGV